jgi:hypothetical protein
MSDYVSAANKVREAEAAVARIEQEISNFPEQRSLYTNLAARQKMAQRFRDELAATAILKQVELCDYRLFSEYGDRFFVPFVAASWLEYQNIFTQTFDALTNGPKRKAVVAESIKEETALEFAYSYAGSLGVVMLAPSERDFFYGKFDGTIEAIYQLLDLDDTHAVRDISEHLGGAVIKRLYDWSKVNAQGKFDVDLKWQRSDGKMLGRVYRRVDAERIVAVIEDTSEEVHTPLDIGGILIGGDLASRSFHFIVPNGESYKGKLSADFSGQTDMKLGDRYRAEISQYVKTQFAKNEEVFRFELERLAPDG